MNFKACNVGGLDRMARISMGLVLLGLTYNRTIGAWGWFGIVPLLTGVFGFCPLYKVLGIKTGKACDASKSCCPVAPSEPEKRLK
jgi:hypothetical protein